MFWKRRNSFLFFVSLIIFNKKKQLINLYWGGYSVVKALLLYKSIKLEWCLIELIKR